MNSTAKKTITHGTASASTSDTAIDEAIDEAIDLTDFSESEKSVSLALLPALDSASNST